MKFEIPKYITPEGDDCDFGIEELEALEDFIKVNIKGRKYGEGVSKFSWGFNLFEYGGIFEKFVEPEKAVWLAKKKEILSPSHFDWKKFAKLSKMQALKLIKKECLLAILRADKLKEKPKTFNTKLFHSEVQQVFDYYIKHA